MKISLDYGSQWDGMHSFDFICVGLYRGSTLNSLCFTLMGLYVDIDFEIERTK
jgi:hypothetical protein